MYDKIGIYKIVNKINNKAYYGSTATSFADRFGKHRRSLNKNKHINNYLQSAWNKYGENNFDFKIILFCDTGNCLYYEQLFLDKYFDNCVNCYNICPTAGNTFGVKCSDKTKNKISKANTGKLHSQETRDKMREIRIGHEVTIEAREKSRISNTGQKRSQETCVNISNALRGTKYTIEARNNMSNALKGNKRAKGHKHSMDTRDKMSKSARGIKKTAEHREKISAALKAWHNKKKEE